MPQLISSLTQSEPGYRRWLQSGQQFTRLDIQALARSMLDDLGAYNQSADALARYLEKLSRRPNGVFFDLPRNKYEQGYRAAIAMARRFGVPAKVSVGSGRTVLSDQHQNPQSLKNAHRPAIAPARPAAHPLPATPVRPAAIAPAATPAAHALPPQPTVGMPSTALLASLIPTPGPAAVQSGVIPAASTTTTSTLQNLLSSPIPPLRTRPTLSASGHRELSPTSRVDTLMDDSREVLQEIDDLIGGGRGAEEESEGVVSASVQSKRAVVVQEGSGKKLTFNSYADFARFAGLDKNDTRRTRETLAKDGNVHVKTFYVVRK